MIAIYHMTISHLIQILILIIRDLINQQRDGLSRETEATLKDKIEVQH
jgi:hypothetical protein